MRKRLMMTTAMLLLSLFTSVGLWADEKVEVTGKLGNDISWSFKELDEGGGRLYILGNGAIPDFNSTDNGNTDNVSPWLSFTIEIKEIEISKGITRIGSYAFSKENLLKDVTTLTLPSTIESIGAHAFDGSGLQGVTVTLNEGLGTIEDYAFNKCDFSAVSNLKFPSTLKTISAYAFDGTGLQGMTLNEGLETIGDYAFHNCEFGAITNLEFPSSLKTIGEWAFASDASNYSKLQNITLNEGLETIGSYAFHHCKFSAVTNLKFPSTLKTLGASALDGTGLQGVTLNEGLETIGNNAFYNCYIETLTIPASVTSIGYTLFSRTTEVKSIKIDEGNTTYTSRDADGNECNVIVSIADKKLISAYDVSTLPQDLKAIGDHAFSIYKSKEIELPASVETIDDYAFISDKVEKVILGENVTNIGRYVFASGLQTLVFNSLEPPTFGDGCFQYAKNLTTIDVPADKQTLLKYKAKKELASYNFTIHGNRFYAVIDANKTLTFRYDSNMDFGTDVNVFEFNDFGRGYNSNDLNTAMTGKGYDDGIKYITTVNFDESVADFRPTSCASWFSGFSNLTAINNLDRLNTEEATSMQQMFYNCSKLTSIDLSKFNTAKVTDMNNMFYGCAQLQSLDLSSFNTSEVTNMSRMFWNLTSLTDIIYVSDGFKTDKVKNNMDMFRSNAKLKPGDKEYANYTDNGNFKKKVGTLGGEPLGAKKKDSELTIDNLTLADDKQLVLTETEPVKAAKASYSRKMTSTWGTLCLPYDIDADDETGNCRYYAVETMTNDAITLKQLSGTITAATPVIFCRKASSTDANVTGSGVLKTTAGTKDGLVGTFETKTLDDADYFIAKDAFRLAGDYKSDSNKGVKVAPYRAYIQWQGGTQPSVLHIMGGQATGISNATADDLSNAAAEYYTADGRRTDGLQKGLNIVKTGGKTRKVIVK